MPHFHQAIVANLCLYVGLTTAGIVVSPPNNTRLGQLCTNEWGTRMWLPHSGTCVERHADAAVLSWEQWWARLSVGDVDGKRPKVKQRPAVMLDDRDLEHLKAMDGFVSMKALGDTAQSTSYKWCFDVDCNRTTPTMLLPSPLNGGASPCVYFDSSAELLVQKQCSYNHFYAQMLLTERKAITYSKALSARRVSTPVLSQLSGVSKERCMMKCMWEDDCAAFNYATTTRDCQLTIQADHNAVADSLYDVYYAHPQQY